jgi:hypothetical protein
MVSSLNKLRERIRRGGRCKKDEYKKSAKHLSRTKEVVSFSPKNYAPTQKSSQKTFTHKATTPHTLQPIGLFLH